MKIKSILTRRNITNYSSGQIVYEWEDEFSKFLSASVVNDNDMRRSRLCSYIPVINKFLVGFKDTFVFNMQWRDNKGLNMHNVYPLIIDFYSREDSELEAFYDMYRHNPLVMISSCEVFDFLKEKKCPLNIAHLGLSLPDKYRLTNKTRFEKKYDLVMMGRQNCVLEKYTIKYAQSHPDFTYIRQLLKDGHSVIYDNNDNIVGEANSREKYMKLLSMGRSVLYSTPDIDTDSKRAHGFNQVTPRFLECIASGCHIIARYPNNSDVDYYELDKMVLAKVNSYAEFEKAMDYARSNDVDFRAYVNYLDKHYTSVRAIELQSILEKI